MRVVKPAWVEHTGGEKKKKCPVYSLSVHPDGTRLATGGLDRKVKIWSTVPILDPEADKVDENPKLLCAMSEHTGSVLAVRWAHHGRFLASGSDDQVAMIWGLDPEGGGRLWGSDEVNVENWKPLTRLVGHVADIIDMAWSRDDSMLASVGLDSTVWIWDGTTFVQERLRKLDRHQGFVKGVCWDPVGQFLATQSDDKTVKIWDTDTWEEVQSVSEPFANSGHATFFRRLSWSPDGAFIAASNAKNGPVFVAAVIEREKWEADISFVGHSNTIQVASFNPRLFFPPGVTPARNYAACVLALGADDFSISIWRNTLHQPIIVLHNIFEHALLDLCWSNDGHHLYGSSEDGTICAISFDDEEFPDLGTPEQTDSVLAEYEYKPQRRVARSLPSATPSIAHGFGTPAASSATVNVLQARKTRPGDNRRRVNLSKAGPPNQALAGPSRHQALAPPPISVPNGHQSSAFDGPIQEQYTSPSQAQASTQRMFEGASTAFAGATQKRRASLNIDDRAAKGRNMATSSRVTLDVQEIRATRITQMASSSSGRHLLPLPTIQTMLRATSNARGSGSTYLEARNARDAKGKNTAVLVQEGADIWVDFFFSPAVALALGEKYSVVGCEDGSVLIYSPAGRRLHYMRLPSIPVELSIAGNMVAVLTADCEVRVINAKTGKAIGSPVSCAHLLSDSTTPLTIRRCEVYSGGVCVLRTSEPAAYALDPSTSAFVPLITPFELSGSPLFDRGPRAAQPKGPLAEIEADILSIWSGSLVIDRDKPEWWDEALSLNHLGMRIRGAELLESGDEYKHWVLQYAKIVGDEEFRERAEELIKDLMGPVYRSAVEGEWKSQVGGVQKRVLVQDVIAALHDSPLRQLAEQYHALLKFAAESGSGV